MHKKKPVTELEDEYILQQWVVASKGIADKNFRENK